VQKENNNRNRKASRIHRDPRCCDGKQDSAVWVWTCKIWQFSEASLKAKKN